MPIRVQMSRRAPWRHRHPDAVIVDRRSRWGNPYPVATRGRQDALTRYCAHLARHPGLRAAIRTELAGRDLACWCPLDLPCHADILLSLANEEPA